MGVGRAGGESLRLLIRRPDPPPFPFLSPVKKERVVYECTACGAQAAQMRGKCPECGEWGSLAAARAAPAAAGGGGGAGARAAAAAAAGGAPPPRRVSTWVADTDAAPRSLASLTAAREAAGPRWRLPLPGPTGAEVARVLGGGVVPGSLILVGGDPGVGKSTLALQVAALLAGHRGGAGDENGADDGTPPQPIRPVLYVSAEESVDQVAARATRLGLGTASGVMLAAATRVEDILASVATLRPAALVVDSIQTVYLDGAAGSAGSVAQVRECATAFVRAAKAGGPPTLLIGHVTKSGDVAGPRVLEHVVDAVLYLEGERGGELRVLRAVKNRFGATDEVGVFRMAGAGLAAVPDPSAALVAERELAPNVASGATVALEGTRPLLLEVQALVAPSGAAAGGAPPLRSPGGVRRDRLALIIAVLGKHAKLRLGRCDVHANVVGGVDAREPSADLAVAAALAASVLDAPARRDAVAFGEVGLGGELRSVPRIGPRLVEAAKLGFRVAVIPAAQDVPAKLKLGKMAVVRARTVAEALPHLVAVAAGKSRRRRAAAPGDGEDSDLDAA